MTKVRWTLVHQRLGNTVHVCMNPMKCTFCGYYGSALRGCWACKFLNTLDIDQGYLAPTATVSIIKLLSYKVVKLANYRVCLKVSVCASITSGVLWVSAQSFFPYDAPRARGYNVVTFCCKACPLKFVSAKKAVQNCSRFVGERKKAKIQRDFWQLSTLNANISETDQQIENLRSWWSHTTPPTFPEKKTVNSGSKKKKLCTCTLTHPSWHFSGRLYVGR